MTPPKADDGGAWLTVDRGSAETFIKIFGCLPFSLETATLPEASFLSDDEMHEAVMAFIADDTAGLGWRLCTSADSNLPRGARPLSDAQRALVAGIGLRADATYEQQHLQLQVPDFNGVAPSTSSSSSSPPIRYVKWPVVAHAIITDPRFVPRCMNCHTDAITDKGTTGVILGGQPAKYTCHLCGGAFCFRCCCITVELNRSFLDRLAEQEEQGQLTPHAAPNSALLLVETQPLSCCLPCWQKGHVMRAFKSQAIATSEYRQHLWKVATGAASGAFTLMQSIVGLSGKAAVAAVETSVALSDSHVPPYTDEELDQMHELLMVNRTTTVPEGHLDAEDDSPPNDEGPSVAARGPPPPNTAPPFREVVSTALPPCPTTTMRAAAPLPAASGRQYQHATSLAAAPMAPPAAVGLNATAPHGAVPPRSPDMSTAARGRAPLDGCATGDGGAPMTTTPRRGPSAEKGGYPTAAPLRFTRLATPPRPPHDRLPFEDGYVPTSTWNFNAPPMGAPEDEENAPHRDDVVPTAASLPTAARDLHDAIRPQPAVPSGSQVNFDVDSAFAAIAPPAPAFFATAAPVAVSSGGDDTLPDFLRAAPTAVPTPFSFGPPIKESPPPFFY